MAVADDKSIDYYEVLQVSPNADPDTIHRIYRLMAQRFHPDNQETGDDARFRAIHEAYVTLSDPQKAGLFGAVGGIALLFVAYDEFSSWSGGVLLGIALLESCVGGIFLIWRSANTY